MKPLEFIFHRSGQMLTKSALLQDIVLFLYYIKRFGTPILFLFYMLTILHHITLLLGTQVVKPRQIQLTCTCMQMLWNLAEGLLFWNTLQFALFSFFFVVSPCVRWSQYFPSSWWLILWKIILKLHVFLSIRHTVYLANKRSTEIPLKDISHNQ